MEFIILYLKKICCISGSTDHILWSTGSGSVTAVQRFHSSWALQNCTIWEASCESRTLLVSLYIKFNSFHVESISKFNTCSRMCEFNDRLNCRSFSFRGIILHFRYKNSPYFIRNGSCGKNVVENFLIDVLSILEILFYRHVSFLPLELCCA